MKAFFIFILLAAIICFAAIVRSTGIATNNILFLFDNGRDLLFVKKLIVDHRLLLIGPSSGGIQGYFHGVLWYYLLSIPFLLGHGNPQVFTIFMAAMSTLSAVATFFILKKIVGLGGAFLGLIIFSFASFSVATAKFIWNPYPIVWLMPFYFLGLYLFTRRKSFSLVLLAGITALMIHFEAIYGVCLLPTLIVLMIISFLREKNLKKSLKKLALSLVVFLLPIIPTLLFDLRHHFLITSSLMKTFLSGGETITHSGAANPLPIRFIGRLQDLFTYSVQSVSTNTILNVLLLLLTGIGVYLLIRRKQAADVLLAALCLLTLLVPFFFFLTLKFSVWSYYWIGSTPLYVLFTAYVLGASYKKWKLSYLLGISVISLFLLSLYAPWISLTHWKTGDIGKGTQNLSTEIDVVNTIETDSGKQPFSVFVQTPPVYDYVYEYLFWWKGYAQFKKYPEQQKQPLTYVIIEGTPTDLQGTYFKQHTLFIYDTPDRVFPFKGGPLVEKFTHLSTSHSIDQNYFPSL